MPAKLRAIVVEPCKMLHDANTTTHHLKLFVVETLSLKHYS
jgi:hypothetical protein